MGEQSGGAGFGILIVHAYVDADVIAPQSRVVSAARVEERAADGMLGVERPDRPAVIRVVVDVVEIRGQGPRHAGETGPLGVGANVPESFAPTRLPAADETAANARTATSTASSLAPATTGERIIALLYRAGVSAIGLLYP